MLELRNYFTEYIVVVKAKKKEELERKTVTYYGVLPQGLRVLQRGARKRKGQKKDQKRDETVTLQVNYLVIDIDLFGIKNYYIEFTPKYNVAVWRSQTKG